MGCTPPAEVEINNDLVRRLVDSQVPSLAELPLQFQSSGWDNDIYRLGERFAVRLPRRQVAVALIKHEQRWLPELAKLVSVAVPELIHAGEPERGYPWPWSIVRWVSGTPVFHADRFDSNRLSLDLARALNGLHVPADPAAPVNDSRGVPLADRDERTRHFLVSLPEESRFSQAELLERWEEALHVPQWTDAAIWLHGDVHPLNLLVNDGRLSGLIDFGDVTSGDPATDCAVAWMLFDAADRESFRATLRLAGQPIDEATWARARGWALSIGAAVLASSSDSTVYRKMGQVTIQRVLDDD